MLAAQRIPSVSSLLRLQDALQTIASGRNTADLLKTVDTERAKLPVVDMPKTLIPAGKEKEVLLAYRTEKLAELTNQLRKKLSGKKINPKDVQKIADEFLAHLEPHITLRSPASTMLITCAPTIWLYPMTRSWSASTTSSI